MLTQQPTGQEKEDKRETGVVGNGQRETASATAHNFVGKLA